MRVTAKNMNKTSRLFRWYHRWMRTRKERREHRRKLRGILKMIRKQAMYNGKFVRVEPLSYEMETEMRKRGFAVIRSSGYTEITWDPRYI